MAGHFRNCNIWKLTGLSHTVGSPCSALCYVASGLKRLRFDQCVFNDVQLRVAAKASKYRERNFKMREWVQLQEGRAGFIDYESLSLMDNAPPTTAHDKHYMCYVTWPQAQPYPIRLNPSLRTIHTTGHALKLHECWAIFCANSSNTQ